MSKKKEHPTQFRKSCIFCGLQNKLTEEHVFPQWLQKVLPSNHNSTFNNRISGEKIGEVVELTPFFKPKQGAVGTKRLKVVCDKCNNEWLSENFETPIKPIITDLVLGKNCVLNRASLEMIALWTVKTCMVGEFDDVQNRGIPQSDLFYLRQNARIPPGWYVWIGKYEGEHQYRYTHIHSRVKNRFDDPSESLKPNSQRTILIIGNLILLAMSAPPDMINRIDFSALTGYVDQIWPTSKISLLWPSRPTITDQTWDKITWFTRQ